MIADRQWVVRNPGFDPIVQPAPRSTFAVAAAAKPTASMGANAPRWIALRNVSDPQFKAQGTLSEQAQLAAQIYKGFGRWSTVCSSIVCWPLIATE